jgi:hypothetical protein
LQRRLWWSFLLAIDFAGEPRAYPGSTTEMNFYPIRERRLCSSTPNSHRCRLASLHVPRRIINCTAATNKLCVFGKVLAKRNTMQDGYTRNESHRDTFIQDNEWQAYSFVRLFKRSIRLTIRTRRETGPQSLPTSQSHQRESTLWHPSVTWRGRKGARALANNVDAGEISH